MHRLVIIGLLFSGILFSQDSPHGAIEKKCTDCHTTQGWNDLVSPMKFNHSSTSFVLYGQHRAATCKQCHTTLQFAGTPANCVSCHQKDFDHAVAVDHRKAGFQTDCKQCHSNEAFSWNTGFDHNKTQFPIRGIHEAVPCNNCHSNGLYRGTPTQCVACHSKEYQAASNPNHVTAGFSTDCATCHRALTWQPAAFFPHQQFFPIAAGDTHRPGRWQSCTDCHSASPNYSTFECINCHEHSQSSTDRHHGEVSGYVYQSSACYRCHPSGNAE